MARKYLIYGVVAVAFLGATGLILPAVLRPADSGGGSDQERTRAFFRHVAALSLSCKIRCLREPLSFQDSEL